MAISGILVSLYGVVISAAILRVAPSFARPIRASVHLFATIDLQNVRSRRFTTRQTGTHYLYIGQTRQNPRR